MDKTLKYLAGSIVTESKLSKTARLQLLNFIQNEATDAQIKALLLDGEVVYLDKQAEEIINARFEAWDRTKTVARTAGTIAASHNVYTAIPWFIYRKIRAAHDTCTKKCGTYQLNTARRQLCMAKCKVPKLKAELAAAKKTTNKELVAQKIKQLRKAEDKLKSIVAGFKRGGADTD